MRTLVDAGADSHLDVTRVPAASPGRARYRGRRARRRRAGKVDVRKFLFSPAVWTSLFGAVGVINTTRNGPRDWRLILNWVITLAGVAIAVGDVMEKSRNAEDY
jgi:hypothetical protein